MTVHVQNRVTEARVSRQWRNIRDGLEKKRPRRWPVVLAAAIALGSIAAIVYVVWPDDAPSAAWSGTVVETRATEQHIELADGTRVVVEPESRLSVCGDAGVCLVVDRGRARFDVTKNADRVFRVRAGDVEVRVVGTRFSITHLVEAERAETIVDVTEGVVEVRAGGGAPRRVSAGQRFAITLGGTDPPPPAAVEEPVEPEPAVRRTPEAPSPEEADALFEQARAARAGAPAEAAQRYGEFVRRFPRDPRAGLAAFELGRIRMDSLGDPAGAVAPLTRALRSSGGAFREDALARLVRVHARLGNTDRCTELRERYVRQYPSGAYRSAVSGLCP